MKREKKDFSDTALSALGRKIKDFFYGVGVDLHNLREDLFGKRKREPKLGKRSDWREKVFIITALIVPIANILVFWVFCNFEAIMMAFEHRTEVGIVYDLFNFRWVWNELNNASSVLPQAIFNTLKYFALYMFVTIPLSYLFAYFIYKHIPGHKVFRYLFFMPSIVSAVIMTSFFKFLLQSDGPIPALFELITGHKVLLLEGKYAQWTLLFYNLWTGFGALLIYFLSALSRIPEEVVESAKLEGVGVWQEIVYVLFPMSWSTFSTFWILGLATIFSASGPVLLMTGGNYGTYDLNYWTYVRMSSGMPQELSFASALGLMETVIALPIALISRWLAGRVEEVEF